MYNLKTPHLEYGCDVSILIWAPHEFNRQPHKRLAGDPVSCLWSISCEMMLIGFLMVFLCLPVRLHESCPLHCSLDSEVSFHNK